MKVKIGHYLKWWGPYQLLGLLNHVGVSEDTTDDWAEKSPEWFTDLCQWIYDKRKRTIKVKIDDYDVWSMDSTLALIVLPMLKQLKKVKHGAPCGMKGFDQTSDSAQWCFDFYAKGDNVAWEAGQEEWNAILDEMIWAFEQLQPDCDWEKQYRIVEGEIDWSKHPEDEGKTCTPMRWTIEPETDYKGMMKHQERISEGLKNFGIFYQNLWD